MSATMQEIKQAACGIDTNGNGKSLLIIATHKYDTFNEITEPTVITECSTVEPIVSITVGSEVTWVTMKFVSETSRDLAVYFKALERYLEESDKADETHSIVSFLTILPLEMGGQYYINCLHPVFWSFIPETAGGEMRSLRVAFLSRDVMFMETDADDTFFDDALAALAVSEAEKEVEEESQKMIDDEETEYGQSDRDKEFTDERKYISQITDNGDEESDDFDPYNTTSYKNRH